MKKHSFTLVELLVVIAIIAVLTAILFPALSSARARSRATSCSSNLKQNGMAFGIYQMNYNDWVALNYYKGAGSTKTWSEFTFGKYNEPGYAGVLGKSTRCPSVDHPAGVHQNHQQYIYGALGFLPTKDTPGKKFVERTSAAFSTGGGSNTASLFVLTTKLTPASAFPMLADSLREDAKYGKVQHYTFKADGSQGSLNLIHRDRANVLFADGHCGTIGKEDAYANGYSTIYYNEKKENSVQ